MKTQLIDHIEYSEFCNTVCGASLEQCTGFWNELNLIQSNTVYYERCLGNTLTDFDFLGGPA